MDTPNSRPTQLGLTGGIGSGKSTVARFLVETGAGLIDADALSRQCTLAGGAAIEPIRQTFGADFIDTSGALDRVRMRQHCFADPQERKKLESIIHPIVRRQSLALAAQYTQEGRDLIVWDIPLLSESGDQWRSQLDGVLVIDCSAETQIQRVLARSRDEGRPVSEADVRAVLQAQSTREQRLRCADFVIHNEGLGLDDLRTQVLELVQLLPRFRQSGKTGLSSGL